MNTLTEHELALTHLVIKGLKNKEIAKELHIAIPTVKAHLRNIFKKFNISNRVELTAYAIQNGLV